MSGLVEPHGGELVDLLVDSKTAEIADLKQGHGGVTHEPDERPLTAIPTRHGAGTAVPG